MMSKNSGKNINIDKLEKQFLKLCDNNDRDIAIKVAANLVDNYKQNSDFISILKLNKKILHSFNEPLASTPSRMILKEGILAALNIIEQMTDDMFRGEVLLLIAENMILLPSFYFDVEFMHQAIERLTACYETDYQPILITIAYFLPAIEKSLGLLQNSFEKTLGINGFDQAGMQDNIELCDYYHKLIFCDDWPELEQGEPYHLALEKEIEPYEHGLDMHRKERALASELFYLSDDEKATLSPHFRERHEELLSYYKNIDPDIILEIERNARIASCIAVWRYIDINYVCDNIEQYAQKLLEMEIDNSIPTSRIYSLQMDLLSLESVYEMSGDDIKRFETYLRYLKLGNIYFKRMIFEYKLNYYSITVKTEYSNYHNILARAINLADENHFSVNELYIEICKRKNLLYLGEMWQRQGVNMNEIHRLLESDFTLAELMSSLNNDSMLLDFFYIQNNFEVDEKEIIDQREYFDCFVFFVKSSGDIYYKYVDKGDNLVQNIITEDNSTAYFKNIINRILNLPPKINHLIICADGDVNCINIASLPYLDGYVIDYYAVRNIASVLDIVYPNTNKPINKALIYGSPDFGETINEHKITWKYLHGSEREIEVITNTLIQKPDLAVNCIYKGNATKEALLHNLVDEYGILHISTHGAVVNNDVTIITAYANMPDNDAIINNYDFEKCNLHKTSIAVLALCFGAHQLQSLQDSLSGFIKELLLSGVNTIIAPIKPIDDLSTVILLNEFYKYYLYSHDSKYHGNAEWALKKAIHRTKSLTRIDLYSEYNTELDSEKEFPFSEPYHWSPWVCFSKERMRLL